MTVLKTHRGFALDAQSAHPAGYVDLPLVDTLYHRMETTNDFVGDFDYLQDVTQAAKQLLFNSAGHFILTQQLKTPCSNWVLNFTLSTLGFINGRARNMALENFRDLMVFHPVDVVSADFSKLVRELDLGWMFTATAGDIIGTWLSREDGLTDLVMSLKLIGGSLPKDWHEYSDAS